jgi:hypothetical protein
MFILKLIAGSALLTLGRKLFWLFVAGVGFFAAIELASRYLHGQPEWMTVLLALGAGLIGALLAIFFQSMAIWLAGFIGGGFFAASLLALLGVDKGALSWIVFLIGGIAGGVLVATFFDWALIILSSLGGASLISGLLHFSRPFSILAFIILFIIGLSVQVRLMRTEKKH